MYLIIAEYSIISLICHPQDLKNLSELSVPYIEQSNNSIHHDAKMNTDFDKVNDN